MLRDFPEHAKDCSQSYHRRAYQDLHLHGAYYQFVLGKISLYPERPICMYMLFEQTANSRSSERVAITYRKKRNLSAWWLKKRYAFEDRFYRIPNNWLEPKDSTNLVNEDLLPERAFNAEKYLFCLSTRDIGWLEPEVRPMLGETRYTDAGLRNPFTKLRNNRIEIQKAIREPFTWHRGALEKWIHDHFNVKEMNAIAPHSSVMVVGSLKEGNQLSYPKKTLKTYSLCGDSGVEVDGQPCGHAITGYGPTSLYYGRCTYHPRTIVDDTIYDFTNRFYDGEGRFFFIDDKIILMTKDLTIAGERDPSYTHMNGKPLQHVLDPWL
jgi:hypothetical protein